MKRFYYFLKSVLLTITLIFPVDSFSQRVEGPIVFYTFETVENDSLIKDVSGVDPIIDLVMTDGVTKIEDRNGVVIENIDESYTHGLYSIDAPEGLNDAIQNTYAFTVEFWGKPTSVEQWDARMVTYSLDGGNRNFSLLLQYASFETRVRTITNGLNGYNFPWQTADVLTEPVPEIHVVWTYEAGEENLYYDGDLLEFNDERGHDISNWDSTYKLIIGVEDNNVDTRRQYEGEVYMVAIYDWALSEEEVKANYDAGNVPGITSIGENSDIASLPKAFTLDQNYPNPFNPETTIKFEITERSNVKLSVYDIHGQEITVLVNGYRNAGKYTESFSGSNLTSGIYFYRLESNGFSTTKRMLFLK